MPPYASVAHTLCSCKVAKARHSPHASVTPLARASQSKQCWMLQSLNVSVNMVLAQQTVDEVVTADSSFMFYLSKLSGYVTSACNFQLNQRSFLHQQQTGRRDVSDKFVSCWNSGSQHWCSAIYTGEKGTKPPRLQDAPFGASSPWHSNTSNVLIICQIL